MSANLAGASIEDSVAKMRSNREEQQPANTPDLEETTGGTDETTVTESHETEADSYELEAEVDGTNEHIDEGEELEAPSKYTVKVNGEELEVNLDELRSGYQRDQDYRKKTMDLAEQRKTVEAENAAVAERVQKLASLIGEADESIDWESLKNTDPTEFIRLKDLQEERKATLESEQAKQSDQQQLQRQNQINVETKKLVEHMGPTWIDDKRVNTFKEADAYLESMGVSKEESSNFIDSRLWKMIFDGMEYQKIKGNKSKVSEQIQSAPKSVKPGTQRRAKSQTELDSAKSRLQGSNRHNETDNAVAFMKAKRGKKK